MDSDSTATPETTEALRLFQTHKSALGAQGVLLWSVLCVMLVTSCGSRDGADSLPPLDVHCNTHLGTLPANATHEVPVEFLNRSSDQIVVRIERISCKRETVLGPLTILPGEQATGILQVRTGAPTAHRNVRIWRYFVRCNGPEETIQELCFGATVTPGLFLSPDNIIDFGRANYRDWRKCEPVYVEVCRYWGGPVTGAAVVEEPWFVSCTRDRTAGTNPRFASMLDLSDSERLHGDLLAPLRLSGTLVFRDTEPPHEEVSAFTSVTIVPEFEVIPDRVFVRKCGAGAEFPVAVKIRADSGREFTIRSISLAESKGPEPEYRGSVTGLMSHQGELEVEFNLPAPVSPGVFRSVILVDVQTEGIEPERGMLRIPVVGRSVRHSDKTVRGP